MEWHEIITPKQNVYYGVEILFPEIIYLAMMLPVLIESGRRNYGPRKSSQVEKSRLTLSEYLGDKASLEVFAAGAWQALAKVIGQEETDKIHLMTDYLVQFRKLHDHIPDPYYGEASGFELVLDLLEDACEGLLLSIKRDHLLI